MARQLENDKTGKDLEGSNHGLIKVLLSAAAYKKQRQLQQDSWCPQ
jgi:hypothetical protein